MTLWLWAVVTALCIAILALVWKILLMQKSARELEEDVHTILSLETNTLLGVSSGDKHMRRLAAALNRELRQLRRKRHRFQQGDRLLKEAVTGAAHDLRTPLTAIQGYLDLLAQEEKSETAERYLSLIGNRVDAMTALTEELFRYSTVTVREDEAPEPLSLNAALEEALAACYAAFTRRGLVPAVTMPETPVWRTLPRQSLARVLGNILENALKYSQGDLAVTLTKDGHIHFQNQTFDLTPVEVGHLFDRFYTVQSANPHSTGLGLSIARQLTEQMSGTLTAALEDKILTVTLQFTP